MSFYGSLADRGAVSAWSFTLINPALSTFISTTKDNRMKTKRTDKHLSQGSSYFVNRISYVWDGKQSAYVVLTILIGIDYSKLRWKYFYVRQFGSVVTLLSTDQEVRGYISSSDVGFFFSGVLFHDVWTECLMSFVHVQPCVGLGRGPRGLWTPSNCVLHVVHRNIFLHRTLAY